ncbi:MAG: DNA mismatch repair protein MutS, partial [Bacteroidetes bacterium]
RKLVDDNHFQLDKLLNRTEQDLQKLDHEKIELQKLLKENERLKKELTTTLNKEKHQQQVELLKHQNKVTEEKWQQLKETERKLKHLVLDWRKSDKKEEVIKQMQAVLFPQQQTGVKKMEKKLLEKYQIVAQPIEVGTKVKLKNNAQIGTVKEIRGKRAVVQIGLLPMSVAVEELLPIQEKNVNKI